MVKTLIGKKIGMTQVYDETGKVIPVTAIQVGPCVVVQLRGEKADGTSVVQIGYGERKRKQTPKPLLGHFDKVGVSPRRVLRDVDVVNGEECEIGQEFNVDVFENTSVVDVIGKTKGRGFAGVIKRHGFHGGPATHGSKFHRTAGSVGPGTYPGRVIKGRKMPGRMGNERVTARNLEVAKVDTEKNLLLVKGSIPGAKGGDVLINKVVAD